MVGSDDRKLCRLSSKEHNGSHGWMRCVQSRGRSAGRKEGRKTNVAVLRSDLAVMLDGYCVAYKHLGQTSTRFGWRHALANQERQYFMLIWSHTMTIAIVRVFVGGAGLLRSGEGKRDEGVIAINPPKKDG